MKLGKTLPFAIAALVIGLLLGVTILTPGAVDAQETTNPDEKTSSAERWAEILGPLVEDGTITEDQAQAVAEHLAATIPGRHGRFFGRVPGLMLYAEAAELIGMEPVELRQALSEGSTLAEVAEDNGLDTESLINGLVAALGEMLDRLVDEDKLTEDRAAQILENAPDRLERFVNAEVKRRGFWLTPGS